MKRLYVRREDIMHHDSINKNNSLIYYSPIYTTGNRNNFKTFKIEAYSVKTGKKARQFKGYVIEIENVSGIFIMVNTNKKFRTNEMLYMNSKPCKLIPVARLKRNNNIIYNIR